MATPAPAAAAGWEPRVAALLEEVRSMRRTLPGAAPPPPAAAAPPPPALRPQRDELDFMTLSASDRAREGHKDMWKDCPLAPPDSIFGLANRFKQDPSPKKVNLVIGAYRTAEGKPYLLPSVALAEERLAQSRINKLHGRIDGLPDFVRASAELCLGPESPALREGRVALCQTLSGTGALAITANFFSQFLPIRTGVYLSRPTWANHRQIFEFFGFHNIQEYRYWNPESRGLDFEGLIEDLGTAPPRSIVVLHLCAHNPTGCDPTPQQWRQIAQVLFDRRHHIVFDSAYQGYATGDLDRDGLAAKIFEQAGLEFAITQSYSKNMGLYGERIGCCSYVCNNVTSAQRIQSQMRAIVRVLYSNPPIYGARIVAMLLTDPELRKQWGKELKGMSERIILMRKLLREKLEKLGTPGKWNHITQQIGMFSYTGLSQDQCAHIVGKWHVYMLSSGRISMAGLTLENIEYVAEAMDDAVRKLPTPEGGDDDDQAVPPKFPVPYRLPSPVGMWTQTPAGKADDIFSAHRAFVEDSDPRKVNLVMVAKGTPKLRPVVAEAEIRLAGQRMQKEYAPIDGDRDFCVAAAKMTLGAKSPALVEGRVALCQTVGATGALSMIASFYSRFLPRQTRVYFSNPTWPNHIDIFENMGFLNTDTYRYWNPSTRGIDFDGMCADLRAAPSRSIVVLQLCAHNPTGIDPSREQWRAVGKICLERHLHVVIDNSYQGWASGDVEEDAWPARLFERELRLDFVLATSYGKPMGLYNERIGAFIYVCQSKGSAERIASQAQVIARRMYSNPPLHGARLVTLILNDTELRRKWKKEVQEMTQQLMSLRTKLRKEVLQLGLADQQKRDKWAVNEGPEQCGMFLWSSFTTPQIEYLRREAHIYMPASGRMSISGVTEENLKYIAEAIHVALKTYPTPSGALTLKRQRAAAKKATAAAKL